MERRRAAYIALVLAIVAIGAWLAVRPHDAGDEMPAGSTDDTPGISSEATAAPRALAGHSEPARARPKSTPLAGAAEPASVAAKSKREPVAPDSIRGVVVTDEGSPVLNATVSASATKPGSEVDYFAIGDFGDGRFSFASPAITASGEAEIVAYAPGFAPIERRVAAGTFVVVRLAPGGPVFGRVLAADTRAPIADAQVRLLRYSNGHGVVDEPDYPHIYTNADGAFRAEAPVGSRIVSAYALGYSSQESLVEVRGDAQAETTILLQPMGGRATLHGVVRVDGKAAADAFVSCVAPNSSRGARLPAWAATKSDAEGRYRLASVPLFQKIWVDAGPEHRGFVWLAEHDDRVTDWPLDIDAPVTEAVLGVVTQDGRPLAGVQFTMRCAVHGDARFTSDAEGRFRLTLPCPEARGRTEARTPDGLVFPVSDVPRPTREQPTPSFAVAVPPFGRVRGRVTDRDGQPIVGARVTADRSEVRTNASGAFEIAVRATPDARIRTEAAGFAPQDAPALEVAAGTVVERDVRMFPGGSIHGRVVDESHRAIGSVYVRVSDDSPFEPYLPTGIDGRFSAYVRGVACRVEVNRPGFAPKILEGVEPDSVLPDIVLVRDGSAAGKPPDGGADDAKPAEPPAPSAAGAKSAER